MRPEVVIPLPKGGARINSGPPPDPNALRRDRTSDKDGWTTLPAGGYDGPEPEWPLAAPLKLDDGALGDMLRERESGRWAEIWRTPQAAAWARMGWSQDVAMYVRLMTLGELGDLKAASEARQWSDRLGLNPAAMLRNRWRVASDEVAKVRQERQQDESPAAAQGGVRGGSRGRLTRVAAGGSA